MGDLEDAFRGFGEHALKKHNFMLAFFLLAGIVFMSTYITTGDLPLSSSISSASFIMAYCFSEKDLGSRRGDSKEWQHFYTIFAGRLEVGSSPERAFEEAARECQNMHITPAIQKITSSMKCGESLPRCLLKIDYADRTSRKLAVLVSSVLGKDSAHAFQIIKDFLRLLRKNDILSRERELVLKEGRFKASILATTNAISVAILADIFPLMQQLVSSSIGVMQNQVIASSGLLWIAFLAAILSSSLLLSRGFRVSPLNTITVCPVLAYVATHLLLKAVL